MLLPFVLFFVRNVPNNIPSQTRSRSLILAAVLCIAGSPLLCKYRRDSNGLLTELLFGTFRARVSVINRHQIRFITNMSMMINGRTYVMYGRIQFLIFMPVP